MADQDLSSPILLRKDRRHVSPAARQPPVSEPPKVPIPRTPSPITALKRRRRELRMARNAEAASGDATKTSGRPRSGGEDASSADLQDAAPLFVITPTRPVALNGPPSSARSVSRDSTLIGDRTPTSLRTPVTPTFARAGRRTPWNDMSTQDVEALLAKVELLRPPAKDDILLEAPITRHPTSDSQGSASPRRTHVSRTYQDGQRISTVPSILPALPTTDTPHGASQLSTSQAGEDDPDLDLLWLWTDATFQKTGSDAYQRHKMTWPSVPVQVAETAQRTVLPPPPPPPPPTTTTQRTDSSAPHPWRQERVAHQRNKSLPPTPFRPMAQHRQHASCSDMLSMSKLSSCADGRLDYGRNERLYDGSRAQDGSGRHGVHGRGDSISIKELTRKYILKAKTGTKGAQSDYDAAHGSITHTQDVEPACFPRLDRSRSRSMGRLLSTFTSQAAVQFRAPAGPPARRSPQDDEVYSEADALGDKARRQEGTRWRSGSLPALAPPSLHLHLHIHLNLNLKARLAALRIPSTTRRREGDVQESFYPSVQAGGGYGHGHGRGYAHGYEHDIGSVPVPSR